MYASKLKIKTSRVNAGLVWESTAAPVLLYTGQWLSCIAYRVPCMDCKNARHCKAPIMRVRAAPVCVIVCAEISARIVHACFRCACLASSRSRLLVLRSSRVFMHISFNAATASRAYLFTRTPRYRCVTPIFIYLKSTTEGPEGHLYCRKNTETHKMTKKTNKQHTMQTNPAVEQNKDVKCMCVCMSLFQA